MNEEKSKIAKNGVLYLIPNTLGDSSIEYVIPSEVISIIENCTYFIVENEKSARHYIKRVCPNKSQKDLILYTLNKYTDPNSLYDYIVPCQNGFNVGIISEAGCPAVADPGSLAVDLAHKLNIEVVPLVGPSSILLSIMASGLNGQSFAFNGYLPIDKDLRKKRLKNLEKKVFNENQSQLFIETPYRNNTLFADILNTCNHNIKLCVACDVTLKSQFIKTNYICNWKKELIDISKRPTIFILGL